MQSIPCRPSGVEVWGFEGAPVLLLLAAAHLDARPVGRVAIPSPPRQDGLCFVGKLGIENQMGVRHYAATLDSTQV